MWKKDFADFKENKKFFSVRFLPLKWKKGFADFKRNKKFFFSSSL